MNGQPVTIHSANDAIRLGIGMVHQHFMLIPELTVTENIILGNEVTVGPFLDRRKAADQIRVLAGKYGLAIDPKARVGDLPVGARQRVEIVKALYRRADILILDEPTAVLTPQEADDLFKIMRTLVSQGVSIVFITHKLKEVLAVADQITVLRRGDVAGVVAPQEASEASLPKKTRHSPEPPLIPTLRLQQTSCDTGVLTTGGGSRSFACWQTAIRSASALR